MGMWRMSNLARGLGSQPAGTFYRGRESQPAGTFYKGLESQPAGAMDLGSLKMATKSAMS